jgi:hypothetical protein
VQLTESYLGIFPVPLVRRYRWLEVRNAAAILRAVASSELDDLLDVLDNFQLTPGHLLNPGGSKSAVAKEIDESFRRRDWRETHLRLNVEGVLTMQPWDAEDRVRHRLPPSKTTFVFKGETHKVDNFKDRVATEVEWNAKDGNLDRDLSAFRGLYDADVIDSAVIITRHHASVRHAANFLAHALDRVNYTRGGEVERFNTSTTTNIEKLGWRLTRGDAGGCPVLAVGICAETYTPGLTWSPGAGQEAVTQPVVPALDEETERALEEASAAGESQLDDE